MSNNDNLFNFDDSNFTNDFFHLNNPKQNFSLPFNFNGNKGRNITIREDVPIHNAKTIDLPKMQANPNAFTQNTRNRDLIDLLAAYRETFDTTMKLEYHTIMSWKSNEDKRYNQVDALYNDIRITVQNSRNIKRADSGQIMGYQQKWEDEDIVKTFSKLIKSQEYQNIKDGKGYDPQKKTSNRYQIHHPKNR